MFVAFSKPLQHMQACVSVYEELKWKKKKIEKKRGDIFFSFAVELRNRKCVLRKYLTSNKRKIRQDGGGVREGGGGKCIKESEEERKLHRGEGNKNLPTKRKDPWNKSRIFFREKIRKMRGKMGKSDPFFLRLNTDCDL